MSEDRPIRQSRLALVTRIWATREYRTTLLLMILTSLGFSSAFPLISLYLVRDLGAGLSTAGLFFTCEALPGLFAGVLIGRWSDRWRSRLPFLRGAMLWVAAGWLIMTVSSTPWLVLLAGAMFLSVGGLLMAQVFAMLQDSMRRNGETQPELITTIVRTGWSFGWVFGPLAGSALASQAGIRAAFVAAACLYLCALLLLRGFGTVARGAAHTPEEHAPDGRANRPLLVFAGLCAMAVSGQAIRNTYLPIHVIAHLGGSIRTFGTIMAVSPMVELVAMPLAGLLSQRFAIGRIIAVGLALATAEYLLMASSTTVWQLYLTQAMDACVVAVVMGLGLAYAQRLSPHSPGAANGIFFSSFNVSFVLGGLVGSGGVPLLGVPHIFLLPAVLCAVAWVAFLILDRGTRRRAGRDHRPIRVAAAANR